MDRQISDIKGILREEAGLLDKLYSIERNKTSAIIDHNGSLLELLSREQEELVSTVMSLEAARMKRVDEFKTARHIRHRGASLKDIAARMDGPEADQVRSLGRGLKDVMERLRRLQEANQTLIKDNMEYYTIMMTGLRRNGQLDSAYRHDGKEEENLKNSILFNQTA